MISMSSIDIYAITKELQGLLGYRVENVYKDMSDRFFLFKFKGIGEYKNPFLLIEPGVRIHLTEFKHSVPERPSDKTMALRRHLKGSEVIQIQQIEFDRLVEVVLKGKQEYHIYIELFGSRPNFIVVGNENRIIYALWYKKMRHRDLLPGQQFMLPPSRGKSILDMDYEEIYNIIKSKNEENEQIVRTLARKTGGGGKLIEEILFRADILKTTKNHEIDEEKIKSILESNKLIKIDLENISSSVSLDKEKNPVSFHPIVYKSVDNELKQFKNFSSAIDYYYTNTTSSKPLELDESNKKKSKLLKILESQKKTLDQFEWEKMYFKELGDKVYVYFDAIDDLLSHIRRARKKNVSWDDIQNKLALAKDKGISSVKILDRINPEKASILLQLDEQTIEVDFRKSVSDIANQFYERAKKATRKIDPAKEAIAETQRKLNSIDDIISEKTLVESIILKRRKRKWYEKYHWTFTLNQFLVIAGKDISSNEEVAKRYMKTNDLFFHADIQGAPYTVLLRDTSEKEITDSDFLTAAQIAAVFSSGWKVGYGAVDVYHVPAESVSFTAPSGEYLPKGGIMVRGTRNYIKGVDLVLAIGVQVNEFNASVIYGSEQYIRSISPITVIIKPGSITKGKIAKQIQNIFIKKASSAEDKTKFRAIDLNEFVQAIPHDSAISKIEYNNIGD